MPSLSVIGIALIFPCIDCSCKETLTGFEIEEIQVQKGQATYPKSNGETVNPVFTHKQLDSFSRRRLLNILLHFDP